MKFKRISPDTVRCIISQDELMENGLDMEDLMSNSGRTEEFLRKMLALAEQEVGFKVQGGPLTIQVATLPENQLVFTFSEKQPGETFRELLESLRSAMNGLPETGEDTKKQLAGATQPDESGQAKEHETYLLEFSDMDALGGFCGSIALPEEPQQVPESSLYFLKDTGCYQLILQQGQADRKELCRIVSAATDFLVAASADERQIAYIREHGQCVCEKAAITTLQQLFGH